MTGCVICTQLLAGTRRRLPAISDISPYQQPGSSCSNPRGLAPARMQMSWGPAGTFLFLKGTLSPKQLRTSIVGSPYWRKLGPGKCREKRPLDWEEKPDSQLSKRLETCYSIWSGKCVPEAVSQPNSETQPFSSVPGCQPFQRAPLPPTSEKIL